MKLRKITCYNKEFITSNVLTTASPPGERQHPEQTPVSNKILMEIRVTLL